jgi:hypothetical protein
MAPMFNPDPMPVEVMLPLLLLPPLPLPLEGDMTELIGLARALSYLNYRLSLPELKQAAYQGHATAALLDVLVEKDA